MLPRCSSYVPTPRLFLHSISAELKQLWMVASLLIMARAAPVVRLVVAGVLVAASVAALPRRLWQPQLLRLGGLSAVIFFFTLIGKLGKCLVRQLHCAASGQASMQDACMLAPQVARLLQCSATDQSQPLQQ